MSEDVLKKLLRNEVKIYELENIVGEEKAPEIRRKFLERKLHVDLKHIGSYTISPKNVRKNIENMIGAIQVPLGVVGPLKVLGEYASGEFYVPLATTEGALVASVNRGCSVITASGGAIARVIDDKMTRAPVFKVQGVDHALKVVKWIKDNWDTIKAAAESTTRHGKLVGFQYFIAGKNLFIRFKYHTGDAMGMNMATIATNEASKVIEEKTGAKLIALSGNMCVDKKPAALNLILGRGKTVVAEVKIPREIVRKKLKTTPEDFVEVVYRKIYVGSALAGSYGFNAHFANIIAAVFIATGQDVAQVVEGSNGITIAEVTESGDLYVAVYLPSLEIGTVGGGTSVETQREALSIMGCYGSGNAKKFAEILASTVLAGEISLIGALAAQHLAEAHKKLGR